MQFFVFVYKNDVKKRPKGGVICKQIAPPLQKLVFYIEITLSVLSLSK